MSYKQMERRLAVMEQDAARAAEQAYTTWVQTLSDAEFDALIAHLDPADLAMVESMSDAEFDALLATSRMTSRMSARAWEAALQQGKERLAAFHASQERINATP